MSPGPPSTHDQVQPHCRQDMIVEGLTPLMLLPYAQKATLWCPLLSLQLKTYKINQPGAFSLPPGSPVSLADALCSSWLQESVQISAARIGGLCAG